MPTSTPFLKSALATAFLLSHRFIQIAAAAHIEHLAAGFKADRHVVPQQPRQPLRVAATGAMLSTGHSPYSEATATMPCPGIIRAFGKTASALSHGWAPFPLSGSRRLIHAQLAIYD